MQQLPRVDAQVSALTTAQLLSYDSITVSRSDDTASANKFRLTADTIPVTLKVQKERVHARCDTRAPVAHKRL